MAAVTLELLPASLAVASGSGSTSPVTTVVVGSVPAISLSRGCQHGLQTSAVSPSQEVLHSIDVLQARRHAAQGEGYFQSMYLMRGARLHMRFVST